MPFICSVPKCSNKRGGHMFPRESDRLQLWLRAIRMESYVPTKHSRVCRNHFTDSDYELPKDSVINDLMPQTCAVPFCPEKDGGHRFPKDKSRPKQWVCKSCNYSSSLHSRVSHKHFNYDNYMLPKIPVTKNPRPILKKDAVPSIFSWNKANFKKIAPNSRTNYRSSTNVQSTISQHITNYHFKNKPPDGNQNKDEKKKFKVIPLTLKLPKSQAHSHKPSVHKTETTNYNLDTKTQPISYTDNMDLIICEKALEYFSYKFKSQSINQFPTRSKSIPHTITQPTIQTLPPDVTITRTKQYSSMQSHIIPSCFVQSGNNITKIKEEPPDETLQKAVEVETDCNRSISPCKMSVPIQCNLCQCSKLQNQNMDCSTERKFCIENVMDVSNPSEVQFFTGFKDYSQLQYVFELLGDDVNHLNYHSHRNTTQAHNLRPSDEFLLTVIKLRRNKLFTELGFKFRTSKELVGIIFTTWINFLFYKFKEISNWMPKDVIDKHMRYGKTKPCIIIVECAGIQLKLKEPYLDKFKHTTLNPDKSIKVVVEMNELGSSNYVSEALPGSLSDSELIRKCTLEAKSEINGTGSPLNNETQNEIEQSNLANTKSIEKVIGLSKLYTILNGKMDYMLVPLANQIVYVCFMLTNFIKEPRSEAL